jgi:hypothetical protein
MRLAVLTAAGLLALAAGPAGAADPPLLYVPHDAAAVIHDGLGGPTLRQTPAREDGRWPRARSVGKVAGRDLAGRDAAEITRALRAGWSARGAGGVVAVDEIVPGQWTPAGARALAAALEGLGADARRVVFYASPAFVERVGRSDPRRALPPVLGALVGAVSRGRATYLQTYRGDLSPLPAREMAQHPTRWAARWPAGRGELRLILGPDGGAGQGELWARVRATPAGRAMLAAGAAAYGLADAGTARAWLAQYRAFLAAPTSPARGVDVAVAAPGGLTVTRAGARAVRVRITRPGRAVVSVRRDADGVVRGLRTLAAPTRGTVVVRLPRDTRPGVHRVRVVLIGDGLRDRAVVALRVRR